MNNMIIVSKPDFSVRCIPAFMHCSIPKELFITEGDSAKASSWLNPNYRAELIRKRRATKKYNKRVVNRQKLYEKRRRLGRVR